MGKGLGSEKMGYLDKLMRCTNSQVTFISETKSSKVNSGDLVNRFNIADSLVVPSNGCSGGLWMMWNDEVHISVVHANSHVILAKVVNIASKLEYALVCLYGDPYHRQTTQIWNEIASFVYDNLGNPVLCMGDLNEILYDADKSTPNVNIYRMHAFRFLVKQCGFIDLGFSGPAYTWTNRRYSSTPTYERLDRCLVNDDWCGVYPNSNVYNLPIIMSDHAPILLSTDAQFKKPRMNFKFENRWLMEKDFLPHAKSVWLKSANNSFHARTNNLAGALKKWCRKKKPIHQELDAINDQIKNIQMQPIQVRDHALESALVCKYEENMTKLTESYKQRAKKHQMVNGDRNTSYFHHAVLKRRRRNRIASIKDENDVTHFNQESIADTFMHYFSSMFSSTRTNMGRPYLSSIPPQDENDFTYNIPDKSEIWSILKDMRKNASPGPDGFNVAFYIAAWSWIGVRAYFSLNGFGD